ncbi:hypothetical protein QQ045_026902 [Rhodiola kirilowii]
MRNSAGGMMAGGRGREYHIPIPASGNTPGPQPYAPLKRHNTARYYAHRVKESFTTQMTKAICAIFLGLLLIVGIITFILWLSLRPHRPRFYINHLSIPPQTTLLNVPFTFNATLRNPNMNIGIYYEEMSVSCKYQDQTVGSNNMLVSFLYQEPKNTTFLFDVIHGESTLQVQWPAAMRVEFTSRIRFKISSWRSKNHTLHANCEVVLGPDGLLMPGYVDKRCPTYFT